MGRTEIYRKQELIRLEIVEIILMVLCIIFLVELVIAMLYIGLPLSAGCVW